MSTLTSEIANKSVRRNNKYNETVVDRLVNEYYKIAPGLELKIFPYIKDLIIFAAMVGKFYDKKESVETASNTGILLSTFSGHNSTSKRSLSDQHNIILMFGLAELRDMKYLHDDNISEVIKVFEEYSNGGLSIIQEWIFQSTGKPMVLFDRMLDALSQIESEDFELPLD